MDDTIYDKTWDWSFKLEKVFLFKIQSRNENVCTAEKLSKDEVMMSKCPDKSQ